MNKYFAHHFRRMIKRDARLYSGLGATMVFASEEEALLIAKGLRDLRPEWNILALPTPEPGREGWGVRASRTIRDINETVREGVGRSQVIWVRAGCIIDFPRDEKHAA